MHAGCRIRREIVFGNSDGAGSGVLQSVGKYRRPREVRKHGDCQGVEQHLGVAEEKKAGESSKDCRSLKM